MNEKSPTAPIVAQSHQDVDKPASGSASVVTVGEHLKRLYPEHYVTIITRMNEQNGSEHTAAMLSSEAVGQELEYIFLWARTTEGHAFWAKLSERERNLPHRTIT